MPRVRTAIPRQQRQSQILADIQAGAVVRILELATRFGVSTETIRRDLDILSRDGLIDRTYGGGAPSLAVEPGFAERHRRLGIERRRIAAAAAATVLPGEVLFIDIGSTMLHLAEALVTRDIPIVVITNALPVATALGRGANIRVRLCPGELIPREDAVQGPETQTFLSRLNADCVMCGATGLTTAGPTEADSGFAWARRMMIERAERTTLLVDHTKFDVRMLEVVCPLEDLDLVVSDQQPGERLREALAAAGVEVLVA